MVLRRQLRLPRSVAVLTVRNANGRRRGEEEAALLAATARNNVAREALGFVDAAQTGSEKTASQNEVRLVDPAAAAARAKRALLQPAAPAAQPVVAQPLQQPPPAAPPTPTVPPKNLEAMVNKMIEKHLDVIVAKRLGEKLQDDDTATSKDDDSKATSVLLEQSETRRSSDHTIDRLLDELVQARVDKEVHNRMQSERGRKGMKRAKEAVSSAIEMGTFPQALGGYGFVPPARAYPPMPYYPMVGPPPPPEFGKNDDRESLAEADRREAAVDADRKTGEIPAAIPRFVKLHRDRGRLHDGIRR